MDKLILENFRTYKERTEIDFAPITILTGKNNSGKSTIFKAILLLSDYLNSENQLTIEFDGPSGHKHKIDCIKNAITWGNEDKSESFELAFENDGFQFSFIIGDYGVGGLLSAEFKHLKSNSKMILERLANKEFAFTVDSNFLEVFNKNVPEDKIADLQSLSRNLRTLEKQRKELDEQLNNLTQGSKDYLEFTHQKNSLEKRIDNFRKKLNALNSDLEQVKQVNHTYEQILSIEELSKRSLTITSLMRSFLSRYYETENFKKEFGSIDVNRSRFMLFNFVENLNQSLLFNAHHLGPNRTHQARLYLNQNRNMEINEIMATYAHKEPPEGSKAHQFLLKWMKEFEIGTNVKVEDVQATASYIMIINNGKSQNLTDKGFGAGQVLTILMKICNEVNANNNQRYSFRRALGFNKPIIMIEEPETNLHPYLQSRLADMFYDAYLQFGIRFVLETHSEYLIRRYQVLTADLESKLNSSDVILYYVHTDDDLKNSNSKIKLDTIHFLEDGSLSQSLGSGFFDESTKHVRFLINNSRNNKMI